jgi:hypothetical protein
MEILEKIKENKIASFIIFLTLLLFVVFILVFVFQKNKIVTKIEINKSEQVKENMSQDEVRAGYLVKMNENSIDFISLENSRNNDSEKERQENVETFYISLSPPTTPVFRGIEDEKESAMLSDLKMGQEILVQYNKETKKAIRIIIKEAIKK